MDITEMIFALTFSDCRSVDFKYDAIFDKRPINDAYF